jgi:hypothetical protein
LDGGCCGADAFVAVTVRLQQALDKIRADIASFGLTSETTAGRSGEQPSDAVDVRISFSVSLR